MYQNTVTNFFMQRSRLIIASMLKSVTHLLLWNRCVKAPNALLSPLLAVVALVRGKVTRSDVLALVSLLRSVYSMGRAQGTRGLSQYLKACSMYLMKYMAGERLHNRTAFGPCVSLTRGGIPRIIPPAWRNSLSSGSLVVARILLSVFGLYRVLDFRGKFSTSTITSAWTGSLPSDLIAFVPRFVKMWMKGVSLKGLEWWPLPLLSKGAHSHSVTWGALAAKILFPNEKISPSSQGQLMSSLFSLMSNPCWIAMQALARLLDFDWVTDQMKLLRWACRELVFSTSSTGPLRSFESIVTVNGKEHRVVSADHAIGDSLPIGRLATKEEPGKVRVFAIVDAFTQWMLYPVHQALLAWLRSLPQDGTFDQRAAVRTAMAEIGQGYVSSFDLSAATDRLPVLLQAIILNCLIPTFGDLWARLLTERDYMLPRESYTGKGSTVRYAVGQPMGAYSSWAMLAVTHHLIVQFASWRAAGGGALVWFTKYRVLGDDIIIWDKTVAEHYLAIMNELGVAVNPSKSLVSANGSFEFAKRFVYAGQDCSPVPLAALSAVGKSLDVLGQVLRMFAGSRLAVGLRILGFGYRVRGSSFTRSRGLTRAGYARMFLLQPGLCRDSCRHWHEWFTFMLPHLSYFDIMSALGDFVEAQLPKMPTEVPFFFIEAYASELADGWNEEASNMATDGQLHSGYAVRSGIEASLAALFHGMYSTMFVRECEKVRAEVEVFNSKGFRVGPEGIDGVVAWLASMQPTNDLISTGSVQSPGWRRHQVPEEDVRISILRWIKFRLSLGNLRSK